MNDHLIIYLDQNYLSNIAKAKIGIIKDDEQAKFWLSLFDNLKKAVLSDKIACPESDFHGIESMFDRRIEKEIMEVVDELSWGLEFNSWESILTSQIVEAAYIYLDKQPEEKEAWSIAFKSDPQAPVESRMQTINGVMSRINVRLFLPSEVADQDRQNKLGFYNEAQELAKQYSEKPLDWIELLHQSKRSTMDGFLGGIARQHIDKLFAEGSPESIFRAMNKKIALESLFGRLQAIGIDITSSKAMDFLESDQLLNIPFNDVFSSIWAAIEEYYI